MKYRKLPVVIEAFQLKNTHDAEQPIWILEAIKNKKVVVVHDHRKFIGLEIKTLEGIMLAKLDDYIIQGINDEIYPCKPDIFEKTYEAVESEEE